MRRLVVFICLLALVTATVSPASAIVDVGDPKVTRIWRTTPEGEKFTCSATWIRQAKGYISWLLTAGHCASAQFVKRSVNETIIASIDWRMAVTSHAYADNLIDIAVATAPDMRADRAYHAFLAEKAPDAGAFVYIHGFPAGVERVSMGRVLGRSQLGIGVRVTPGEVLPGSSGSVVLNQDGFIVGVLWGLSNLDPSVAYFTPVERLHEIFKLIGPHFNMSPDAE